MTEKARIFWVYSAPAIFYGILIIIMTATPGSYIPSVRITGLDKVVHFGMHFIYAMLVHRALLHQANTEIIKRHALLLTVIFVAIFGIVVEWYQSYIPGRTADLMDGIANVSGALVYSILYQVGLSKIWPERKFWFKRNKNNSN